MLSFIKNNISAILLGILCIYLSFNIHKREAADVIYSDSEGYYMYLPAIFIYNGFEELPIIHTVQFSRDEQTQKVYTKYTCGVAMLEAPFFLIAHVIAKVTAYPADGYSYPYRVAIMIAAVFYLIIALQLLKIVLIKYYKPNIVKLSLFLLLAGTNLYFYAIRQPGMSHIYSFFLFSLLIYLTPKFLVTKRSAYLILYAFILGLIVLIRPTNLVMILYPLFYNITHIKDAIKRIRDNFYFLPRVLLLLTGFLLPFIPQMLYWYDVTGKMFTYSYGDEGFIYWNRPQIFNVLFSVQNGWFIYTPLAFVMIVGLIYLCFKQHVNNARLIFFILLMATYLFASWEAWWFGGAFGHRCFVEYYALLILPLVFVISKIASSRPTLKLIGSFCLLILCYYNLKLTYLYQSPWDGSDWTWATFSEVLKNLI